jgi:hypothetical protein
MILSYLVYVAKLILIKSFLILGQTLNHILDEAYG